MPLENGRDAARWTSATLSCCSRAPNESHIPSLEPVPRTSTTIIAYPFEGKIVLPSETPAPDFRYGVCTRIVGHGHPVVGMYSSESSKTPSDMGILTSETTS